MKLNKSYPRIYALYKENFATKMKCIKTYKNTTNKVDRNDQEQKRMLEDWITIQEGSIHLRSLMQRAHDYE